MAWSHPQAGLGGTTASSLSTTKAITPTNVGNLIVVTCIGVSTNTSMAISDTQAHTWTQAVAFAVSSSGAIKTWATTAKNKTATTITVTQTGGAALFCGILVDEFSGNSLNFIDQGASASDAATTATAIITPGVDSALIYEAIADTASGGGSGWSAGGSDGSGDIAAYKFLGTGTAGTAQSTSFSGASGASMAVIASFKMAQGYPNNYQFVKVGNGMSASERIR
jgi:hypothetical protein